MVDFVKKRLQVFVSSTYADLIEERQAAVEAILTAGHIPAGMELFAAGDESQLEVIKQWIDESDIYLLILGGRYGSVEQSSGKSYTQIEYEYAVAKQKPLFACVIKDDAIEEKVKRHGREVVELNEPQKLKSFRELVTSKVVRFWSDTKDIKLAVIEKLAELTRNPELIGWVRQPSNWSQITTELSRLSEENAQLRVQVANSQIATGIDLTFENICSELERKDLLKFLIAKRNLLVDRYGYSPELTADQDFIRELKIMNLIEPSAHQPWKFFFSETGRKFIVRYEHEKENTN